MGVRDGWGHAALTVVAVDVTILAQAAPRGLSYYCQRPRQRGEAKAQELRVRLPNLFSPVFPFFHSGKALNLSFLGLDETF